MCTHTHAHILSVVSFTLCLSTYSFLFDSHFCCVNWLYCFPHSAIVVVYTTHSRSALCYVCFVLVRAIHPSYRLSSRHTARDKCERANKHTEWTKSMHIIFWPHPVHKWSPKGECCFEIDELLFIPFEVTRIIRIERVCNYWSTRYHLWTTIHTIIYCYFFQFFHPTHLLLLFSCIL